MNAPFSFTTKILFRYWLLAGWLTLSVGGWAAPLNNDTPVRIYPEAECAALGLHPVVFADGQVLLPRHDNGAYVVSLTEAPAPPAVTAEDVKKAIVKLRQAGKVVNDILNVHLVSDLPVVVRQEIGGGTYEILLEKLIFTPTGNVITVRGMIETADMYFAFSGQNVKFSGQGGIESGSLALLLDNNPAFSTPQLGRKIGVTLTGGGFTFGCNGFEDVSLFGKVIFDRSLLVPDQPDGEPAPSGNVQSNFGVEHVRDINDLIISLDMQPFQMPSMKGYGFQVTKAVLDLSARGNAVGFMLPTGYLPALDGDLWKGVSVGNIEVRFPKGFKNRRTQRRLAVGVNNLLIDAFGVSGEFYGRNLMSLQEGDLNGWDYSLDAVQVVLAKNQVKSGSLTGLMRIAIAKENTLLSYQALIDPQQDYYSFSVSPKDTLQFEFLKTARVDLTSASYVALTYKAGEFAASAMLSGSLTIGTDEVKLDQYRFERLFISTQAPYLAIGYFGGGSGRQYQIAGFPISIQSPVIEVANNVAHVEFGVGLNLDRLGVTATGGLVIEGAFVSENNRHFWRNKRFGLTSFSVDADLAVGHFSGAVDFIKNDPIYGNGFYGRLGLTLNYPSSLQAEAAGFFGSTQDRYWFVDARAALGGTSGLLSINMLAGSLHQHMKVVAGKTGARSLSGAVYAPDFNTGWGARFGIGFTVGGGDAFGGMAGLEIETRADNSIREIGFIGSVAVAGQNTYVNPEAVNQAYFLLCNDSAINYSGGITSKLDSDPNGSEGGGVAQKFSVPSDANGFAAGVILKMNFDDHSFYGRVGGRASVAGQIELQLVGAFLFSPKVWFIHIGEPPLANRIIVKLPGLPQIDGYIMLGHGVPELPDPEPNIFRMNPGQRGQRTPLNTAATVMGKGIAFGAALQVSDGGDYKVVSWNVGARLGLDVMLMKYPNGVYCEGRAGQGIGINNWRAGAQLYALGWFNAAAFGARVLSLELGALLRGKTPNPTYATGEVAVRFSLLFVSFNFNVGFKVGDDCVLVGGSEQTTRQAIIQHLTPQEGEQVAATVEPLLTSTQPLETEIVDPSIPGKLKIRVAGFSLSSQGQPLASRYVLNAANPTQALLTPTETLPRNLPISATAHLQLMRFDEASWQPVLIDGQLIQETKHQTFVVPATYQQMQQQVVTSQQEAAKDLVVVRQQETKKVDVSIAKADTLVSRVVQGSAEVAVVLVKNCELCPEATKAEVKAIVQVATDSTKLLADAAAAQVAEIVKQALSAVDTRLLQAQDDVNSHTELARTAIRADSLNARNAIKKAIDNIENSLTKLCVNYGKQSSRYNARVEGDGEFDFTINCRNLPGEIKRLSRDATRTINERYLAHSGQVEADALKRNQAILLKARQACDSIMGRAAGSSQAILTELQQQVATIWQQAQARCQKLDGYASKTDMTGLINELLGLPENDPPAPVEMDLPGDIATPVVPTAPPVAGPVSQPARPTPEPTVPIARVDQRVDEGVNPSVGQQPGGTAWVAQPTLASPLPAQTAPQEIDEELWRRQDAADREAEASRRAEATALEDRRRRQRETDRQAWLDRQEAARQQAEAEQRALDAQRVALEQHLLEQARLQEETDRQGRAAAEQAQLAAEQAESQHREAESRRQADYRHWEMTRRQAAAALAEQIRRQEEADRQTQEAAERAEADRHAEALREAERRRREEADRQEVTRLEEEQRRQRAVAEQQAQEAAEQAEIRHREESNRQLAARQETQRREQEEADRQYQERTRQAQAAQEAEDRRRTVARQADERRQQEEREWLEALQRQADEQAGQAEQERLEAEATYQAQVTRQQEADRLQAEADQIRQQEQAIDERYTGRQATYWQQQQQEFQLNLSDFNAPPTQIEYYELY